MSQKIVHVLNDFPSRSETFIVNHIVETIKNNYKPILLVNNLRPKKLTSQMQVFNKYGIYELAKAYTPEIPKNKALRLLKAIIILFKNLKYTNVLLKTLNRKRYGLKSKTLKMWFQAEVFLKYQNIEIFHGHFGISGKILADMKEIGAIKGKIITSFYGYDTFSTLDNRSKLKKYYFSLFNIVDSIISSSHYLSRNLGLLEAPSYKILVNSVGVDLDKFYYKKRVVNDTFKIITVGRLIKLKGQEYGIKVIKTLIDRGHNVHYTIIGDGEEYEMLKKLILSYSLEKFIKLKQGKTQQELINLLHESHLFLMTSITDNTGRAEGQGLVVAEAQSTGMPVVGFDSGGVPETINHGITGFVIQEKDIIEMANVIEKFIKQPELVNVKGKAARHFVEKRFNSYEQSKNIINLYKV